VPATLPGRAADVVAAIPPARPAVVAPPPAAGPPAGILDGPRVNGTRANGTRAAAVRALIRLSALKLPLLLAGPAVVIPHHQVATLLAAGLAAGPGFAQPTMSLQSPSLPPAGPSLFHLQPPVAGRLAGRFGETLPHGAVRKGIAFSAAAGALVRAPAAGEIAYAARFRQYGLLLILNHGDGYHTVITGISHLDGGMGRHVQAGETIGRAADPGAGPPIVSMELWRHRQPVDPLPLLNITEAKENG
jgi:murein DD-endopeptidase MepM/ murein hydrolase activator NlpD